MWHSFHSTDPENLHQMDGRGLPDTETQWLTHFQVDHFPVALEVHRLLIEGCRE
jgi:hypothetical protein